jgi:iron complex transport system substrate-binding protein
MRVASLVPSATEMLFALGLGESVVAVSHECDFPREVRSLPHLTRTVLPEGLDAGQIDTAVKATVGEGKALYELDEERLASLEPDLIVTQAVCDVCAVSYEEVIEVAARLPNRPRVAQQDPSTLGEMLEDVIRLGEATGMVAEAHDLRGELEGRLATVRAALAGAGLPRVIALEWLDPPYVGGHWVPEMIDLAGGVDALGEAGQRSRVVDWDELRAAEPEVAVVMPCGLYADEAAAQALRYVERLRELDAQQVVAVDAASSFSRPGPRLVDGVELLGHILHPDRLSAPPDIAWRALLQPADSGTR